jgi:glutamyl/glutaminyl-tRNA synthetase
LVILRLDDNQPYWRDKFDQNTLKGICYDMIDDLKWLGIEYDEVIYQSDIEHTVTAQIEKRMKGISTILQGLYVHDQHPNTLTPFLYYGYTPLFTLEKVWMDFKEGVNILIRGEDLIAEYSLYAYFVDLLGLPRVEHWYLPRMQNPTGEMSNLSKTNGEYKIIDLRNVGVTRGEVFQCLRASCLKDRSGEFILSNIRENIILVETWKE